MFERWTTNVVDPFIGTPMSLVVLLFPKEAKNPNRYYATECDSVRMRIENDE